MGCNNSNLNNSWGDILDSEIIYTGLPSQCDFLEITPGMKLKDVLNLLSEAVCTLSKGEEPIPTVMIQDESLTINTTSKDLNLRYPEIVNGSVVYSSEENIQFTKYPTGWKFEIIELR